MTRLEDLDFSSIPLTAFHRERRVQCTRKEHACWICHRAIPAGSEAVYVSHFDGDCFTPLFVYQCADRPSCAYAGVMA